MRVLLWAGLLAACGLSSAYAQGPSCENHIEIHRAATPRLAPYRPSPARQLTIEQLPQWQFGPFDRSAVGFEYVRFYLDLVRNPEESRRRSANIIVRFDSGPAGWFRVVPNSAEFLGTDPRTAMDREAVRLATSDPRLPIFVVTLGYDHFRGEVQYLHVVDLRPARKRVPVTIECYSRANQGACGTWDAVYASVGTSGRCEWDAKRDDFRCAMSSGIETTWSGGRGARWEETLIGHQMIPSPLPTIEQLALMPATGTPTRVETTEGTAQVLLRKALKGGGSWVLVGIAGRSSIFDARFTVVYIDARGQTTVRAADDVALGPGYWTALDSTDHEVRLLPGRPFSENLTMRAAVVFERRDDLSVARVHVRDEGAQAVYWVGVGQTRGVLAAAAMRLATDTHEYFHCGLAATPPNAVAATLAAGSDFAAELEIEPPHEVDLFEGTPVSDANRRRTFGAPDCPSRARVTWRDGFTIEHVPPASCEKPPPPRFVAIDADGTIRVTERRGSQ